MRKIKTLISLILAVCVLALGPVLSAKASATTYTYTLEIKSGSFEFPRTQDAYLPDKTVTSLGLSKPSDIFITPDFIMYICDSGNNRILLYDIRTNTEVGEIKGAPMKTPTGVFVTEDGTVYVADKGAKAVLKYGADHEFIEKFERPTEPSFSDTNFDPLKIAVDNAGNMYIIGEGVYNGIIQLAPTGEFLGYFAVNTTRISFSQMLQKILFTRDQLENLSMTVPTTFSNIFVDKDGIVYSTSMSADENSLKKHNTSGGNMFKGGIVGWNDMTDVFVDKNGIIYASSQRGYIEVYSKDGEFIFEFGSFLTGTDIAGLFTSLPTVAVDPDGYIWAADGDKGYLQSFKPTDYAKMIFSAMDLYESGRYEESLSAWSDVLRLNQMSVLAHNGVGKALFHAQRYKESLEHFEVAENRNYFSEAFWEVRNVTIQKALPWVFLAIILFIVISIVVGRIDKKGVLKSKRKAFTDKILDIPVLGDVLYMFRVARHPNDRYYDIRVGNVRYFEKKAGLGHGKATVVGATIIYILSFIVYMIYRTGKGFIYQTVSVEDMDIAGTVAGFFVLIGLFIISNWLVTSINDGDGNLKTVYMLPAYAFAPLMIGMLVIVVLSYAMTFNESFILTIILIVSIIWSVVNLFCGLMNVHDYTFKETVKSIVMTIFFMIVAMIIALILTIMFEQLFNFITSVGRELVLNVL
ncbi:MAG: YIP1 family protein [Lachnospiraceae bacterium]|nr:YIP1 family protein [Lachnospiraceae bacterium]MBP5184102.1 YIP1 family protein [Lachnospiraceae bacterium]